MGAKLNATMALAASLLLGACGHHAVGTTPLALRGVTAAAHATAGNRELVVLPGDADGILTGLIKGAKKSVRLEIYMLTEQVLVDAMIAAHQRGVDVQVMLEPKPFNPSNPNAPLPVNHKAFNALRAAGVQVTDTSPAFVYTHAKFLTVDDATTVVSTANFTKSGLQQNREYLVIDREPADVTEFVRIFQADQARQAYTPSQPDTVVSPTNSRARIFGVIASAKREVLIADEVASDPALNDLIKQKCAQGVKVRALLGYESSSGPNDVPTNVATARAWMAAGAQVRYQKAPVLHAKAVIADGAAMYVGSENLTTNSLDHNREIGLLLDDAALVKPVVAATEGDWAKATPAS